MSKWSAGLHRATPKWIGRWLGRAGLHRVTPKWMKRWLSRFGLHRVAPRTAKRGLSRNWLQQMQPAPAAAGTRPPRRHRRPPPVPEATFTVPASAAEASAAGVPELKIETV